MSFWSTRWVEEEESLNIRRSDSALMVLEQRWNTAGSVAVSEVRMGYESDKPPRPADQPKCFWFAYPSKVRCFACKVQDICRNYVGDHKEEYDGAFNRGPH